MCCNLVLSHAIHTNTKKNVCSVSQTFWRISRAMRRALIRDRVDVRFSRATVAGESKQAQRKNNRSNRWKKRQQGVHRKLKNKNDESEDRYGQQGNLIL